MKINKLLKSIRIQAISMTFAMMTVVFSIPGITTTVTIASILAPQQAVALSDTERARKQHYAKAANLRKRAAKARSNGNDKKADRLEEKAKKIEQEAP